MTVTCADSAWAGIETHVFSSTDREVGGILVGSIVDGVATITTSLPALAATSGSANVTFTHEVWGQVHEAIDRDHPDERIVGWYHSHPGFGVFLSQYDTFAHSSFFEDPAMLALVIDPHSGEAGWFAMRDGRPTEIETRRTDRDPIVSDAEVGKPSGAKAIRRGATTVVGLTAAAAVIGFFVGASTSTKTVVTRVDRHGASASSAAASQTPTAVVPEPAAATPAQAPRSAPASVLDYRVRRGDSFWELAGSFYGDPHLWRQLMAANPQHPSSQLDVGQHLRVPVKFEATK